LGSGIGGLTFALLERGASSAVAVDASAAYINAARDEATQRGRSDAIRFVHADFVVAASELPSASVVTLDRVVCCYPSCTQLLDAAVARAERCLAISYPQRRVVRASRHVAGEWPTAAGAKLAKRFDKPGTAECSRRPFLPDATGAGARRSADDS
jgi:hypothetical protein